MSDIVNGWNPQVTLLLKASQCSSLQSELRVHSSSNHCRQRERERERENVRVCVCERIHSD